MDNLVIDEAGDVVDTSPAGELETAAAGLVSVARYLDDSITTYPRADPSTIAPRTELVAGVDACLEVAANLLSAARG